MYQPIEDVFHRHERELLGLANVTGVGIGDADGRPVILVFVRQKVPKVLLRPQDVVPSELEGYQVQVRQQLTIGVPMPTSENSQRRPKEQS